MIDQYGCFMFDIIKVVFDYLGCEGGYIYFIMIFEKYGCQWVLKVYFFDDKLLIECQKLFLKKLGKYGFIFEVMIMEVGVIIYVVIKLKIELDF